MTKANEARYRSILKTLSWRLSATVTTMLIFFALTGNPKLALGAGAIEVVAKLLLYYVHERIWAAVALGRMDHPLSALPVTKPLNQEDTKIIRKKLLELGYISED